MKYFGAKLPEEEYPVRFNFTRYLGESIIAGVSVRAVDITAAPHNDATAEVTDAEKQAQGEKTVDVWVRGGVAGRTYAIHCLITGSGGETYGLAGALPVRDA